MLTRSKARALAADNTTIIVSPSATGQGTHTRWKYPAGHGPYPLFPSPPSGSVLGSSSSSSSPATSTGSLSPYATSPDSSLSSLSDVSFHTESRGPGAQIPLEAQPSETSTRPNSPRKLQRSPAMRRYVYGSTHIIQEAPPDDDSMMERRLEEVFRREWDILMKSRQVAIQARRAYEADDESDAMDTDSEYTRGDTEPPEVVPPRARSSRRPRPLGPYGTEIIDHETFMPESSELPIYPQQWVSSRKSLKWQPTEQFTV